MSRRGAQAALVAVAASLASGCTWTHRCTVPTPIVEAAPGPRLPGAVEVRYAPPAVPAEAKEEIGGLFSPSHRMIVSADAPTRALFDRLAASMFERTSPPGPPDAVLEIRLERFVVDTLPFQGNFAAVAYRATLRSGDGAEIGSFDVEGAATVAGSLRRIGFCGARGDAVAVAMQEAGGALVRKVSASEPVAAWLARRGVAPVALAVKPLEAYGPPPTSTEPTAEEAAMPTWPPAPTAAATPTPTPSPTPTPAAPRPVDVGPPPAPLPPRAMSVRFALAAFRPDTSAGRLEDPSSGPGLFSIVFGSRLREWLALEVPLDVVTRDFSANAIPHFTGFGPRATLDSLAFGAGLRVTPPSGGRPPIEPWVGAGARLLYTKLTDTYFGGLTGGDALSSAWSLGAELAAGLDVYLGRSWTLGFEVRRLFARASLDPLGDVPIGGLAVGGSLGWTFPP